MDVQGNVFIICILFLVVFVLCFVVILELGIEWCIGDMVILMVIFDFLMYESVWYDENGVFFLVSGVFYDFVVNGSNVFYVWQVFMIGCVIFLDMVQIFVVNCMLGMVEKDVVNIYLYLNFVLEEVMVLLVNIVNGMFIVFQLDGKLFQCMVVLVVEKFDILL